MASQVPFHTLHRRENPHTLQDSKLRKSQIKKIYPRAIRLESCSLSVSAESVSGFAEFDRWRNLVYLDDNWWRL